MPIASPAALGPTGCSPVAPGAGHSADGASPSPDLIARLLRRVDPPDYFLGANARAFRSIRHVTLFARAPLIAPTADFHHRHVVVMGITAPLTVVVGGQGFLLRRGDALLIPPFSLHGYQDAGAGRVPLAFLGFEADVGEDAPDGVTLGALAESVVAMPAEGWAAVDRIESQLDVAPGLVPALVLELLEHLLRGRPVRAPRTTRHLDWERTQSVAVHARAKPLAGVPELARACGLSEAVLRQAVAEATGLPVGRFVRTLRLRTSVPWLTRRDLVRAAEVAGYETQEAYAKAFKSEFGQAPSRFAEMTTLCSVNARLR